MYGFDTLSGPSDVVAIIWVGLDSETESFPTPDNYPLWEASGLRAKLNALEQYEPTILDAAREHLQKRPS